MNVCVCVVAYMYINTLLSPVHCLLIDVQLLPRLEVKRYQGQIQGQQ